MASRSNSRRNRQSVSDSVTAIVTSRADTLETRQMLSGTPVGDPGQVVDNAIEDHASAQTKQNVADKEAAATTAQETADAEQSALDNMTTQAESEIEAKQTTADDLQREADRKQAAADEARAEQNEHADKAREAREAQQDAYDDIDGPAVLDDGSGDNTPLDELSEDQLHEQRRNDENYLHNSDLNNPDGNFTPWQEWGRQGRIARIHEIDAELARRDADAKQQAADEAQAAADAAQECADETKATWEQKIADQKEKAATAQQAADDARAEADRARDAAAAEARDALETKVQQAEDDVEAARQKMIEKINDLKKALYFARLLGLTPDSFTADDLKAWQDKMDELIEWVEVADDFDLMPPVMTDVIKIASEAIVGAITGLRTTRIRQMEFEVDGIDLGAERNGMKNGTASDWLQDDDTHGDQAAGDDDEARRIMRILLGWNENGIDLSGCLAPCREQLQAAEQRLSGLRCQQSQVADAIVQQTAAALEDTYDLERIDNGDWDDWSGRNEKWIRSSDGWLFITPDGGVHRWQGGRFEDLRSAQVAQLDARYHATPALLHDAEAVQLDQQLGLRFTGSYHANWGGQQEKWLFGGSNWYWLNNEGELYRWNLGSVDSLQDDSELIADGLEEFWSQPERLHDAASLLCP